MSQRKIFSCNISNGYQHLSICRAFCTDSVYNIGGSLWDSSHGELENLWQPEFVQSFRHGSNFLVGDTLVFRMEDENDDIARVMSKSKYEICREEGSKALKYKGGEGIELNTSGSWYFMSTISNRCKTGEKVMIRVVAESVVQLHNQSLKMGRGGGSGGSGGGSGGNSGNGNGGMGNAGGFTTPKGNQLHHPTKRNAAAALTRPFFIVLLALYSILLNIY